MLKSQDSDLLKNKGLTEEQINHQLDCFREGFPFLQLEAQASTTNGILAISEDQKNKYLDVWNRYLSENHSIVKFVPASGAASRMFKKLFEFLSSENQAPSNDFENRFFNHIHDFAFYDELNKMCLKNNSLSIDQLIEQKDYKAVVFNLLDESGLNYSQLPKGLLTFHKYQDSTRTPIEEHLVEAALYASSDNKANIHLTISNEHISLFKELVEKVKPFYEEKYGVTYNVTFSVQKSSTDTIAVDMENNPFRDKEGKLLFRPGGHGALIENLNDLEADVIYIKTIDNVVPDKLKNDTVLYKKVLGGVLVALQKQTFHYLNLLYKGEADNHQKLEMLSFLEKELFCKNPNIDSLTHRELTDYLMEKLNRPIRVCAMVKNVGEPGGGPFLAYNSDGTVSLQILESSQIDMKDEKKKNMFESGTHFNPADLVCGVKDFKGEKFDLTKYVDPKTGFISFKSKEGRDLKALELPGLWNGAMSDWNTIFVEVPLSTFNPVKTVNDLLREQHQ